MEEAEVPSVEEAEAASAEGFAARAFHQMGPRLKVFWVEAWAEVASA
jgi:hypothetical protein